MSRDEMLDKVVDALWGALESQAERFGYVDREMSIVDMSSIELDMRGVAAAAVDAVVEVLGPPF